MKKIALLVPLFSIFTLWGQNQEKAIKEKPLIVVFDEVKTDNAFLCFSIEITNSSDGEIMLPGFYLNKEVWEDNSLIVDSCFQDYSTWSTSAKTYPILTKNYPCLRLEKGQKTKRDYKIDIRRQKKSLTTVILNIGYLYSSEMSWFYKLPLSLDYINKIRAERFISSEKIQSFSCKIDVEMNNDEFLEGETK